MTHNAEEQVVEYLRRIASVEPPRSEQQRAERFERRAASPRRRIVPRARKAVSVAAAMLAASATLAAGAAIVVPITRNPDPLPPAQVAPASVPPDLAGTLEILRRPPEPSDRSPAAQKAAQNLRAPFVIAAGSVRAIGLTPLGESAFVAYVKSDPRTIPQGINLRPGDEKLDGIYVLASGPYGGLGQDGPYPLADIKRGTAFGIKELPSVGPEADRLEVEQPAAAQAGRTITIVVPDGVAQVEFQFRDGTTERHAVHDNVVLDILQAGDAAGPPKAITWFSANGSVLREGPL